MGAVEAAIPPRLCAQAQQQQEGRVSLTNLCGQLVVTGILMDAILLKSPTPHGEGAFEDRAPSTQPARLYRR
jgi:hypothetical protein